MIVAGTVGLVLAAVLGSALQVWSMGELMRHQKVMAFLLIVMMVSGALAVTIPTAW